MRLPMLRLLLVLTLYAWRIQAAQRIVHGPSNSTVRVGQIAVLRCQVAEQVYIFKRFGQLFIHRHVSICLLATQ